MWCIMKYIIQLNIVLMFTGYYSLRFLLETGSTTKATDNFCHSKWDNWKTVPI